LTFDSWTSLNGDPFLAVTRHYIISSPDNPQQWELKTEQLMFTPIVGNYSGENIAKILLETIDASDLHSRVQGTYLLILIKSLQSTDNPQLGWLTTDNATNNDTAICALAQHIDPSSDELDPVQHCVW
jgi:hypothetical protein